VATDHDLAPATLRKHESAIRVHLVPELGHIRLSELSPDDISRALTRRLHQLSPQSVRHLRATLRRCLADAVRDGLVSRNAAALSRPPKLPHTERTILDANQARLLIESTKDTRYGPLWTILVTTGLRISEALGLAWSDVNFGGTDATPIRKSSSVSRLRTEHLSGLVERAPMVEAPRASTSAPTITVRHQLARENGEWVRRPPKTAKGRRTIPLTPLGVEALRAQRAMQREWRFGDGGSVQAAMDARVGSHAGDSHLPVVVRPPSSAAAAVSVTPIDGLVFTTSKGHPLHETNVVKYLARDLAEAGLPRVTNHSLRHSAASLLLKEGVPLPTISAILGHSTIRVTMDIYAHVIEESKQVASDAMQRALG
jgi:integrase